MCLSETYSRVPIGKHLSDTFPVKNSLKQGDALTPLLFNFALEHAVRRVLANHEHFEFKGTYQLVVYADINTLGRSIHATKKHTEALTVASKC
jgi:hypothetical protein